MLLEVTLELKQVANPAATRLAKHPRKEEIRVEATPDLRAARLRLKEAKLVATLQPKEVQRKEVPRHRPRAGTLAVVTLREATPVLRAARLRLKEAVILAQKEGLKLRAKVELPRAEVGLGREIRDIVSLII